jgi:FtsZ-interacting cell division protein ZipA
MNAFVWALMFTAVLLGGCRATKDVAVSSYHVTRDVAVGSYRVATAPVHYALRRHREDAASREVASIETTESDVTQPGQPIPSSEVASAQQPQPRIERERVSSPRSTAAPRVARKEATQSKPKPSPFPTTSSAEAEFPTAKLVPGKPGYVVSPFDSSGRYVDVSGYASGSKVKDPWTDKIFIVP